MLITYLSTLVFEIQYAIYLGVVLSLLMLVRRVGQLQLVEMVESGPRMYREIEIDEETGRSALVLLAAEGDLFFGISEELEEHLDAIASRGARVIIIRMKRAHAIDATAAEALANFATRFPGRLMLCGLKPDLHDQVCRSHLGELLGKENILLTDERNLGSLRRAIERARADLGSADRGGQPLVRRAPSEGRDVSSYSI
jgi:SulP family sulfate permease